MCIIHILIAKSWFTNFLNIIKCEFGPQLEFSFESFLEFGVLPDFWRVLDKFKQT